MGGEGGSHKGGLPTNLTGIFDFGQERDSLMTQTHPRQVRRTPPNKPLALFREELEEFGVKTHMFYVRPQTVAPKVIIGRDAAVPAPEQRGDLRNRFSSKPGGAGRKYF
ncbi:putative glycoside hydrolase [Anopheles sinensis]|uniref:Putative glycoside hydrolase n=1 Tax=Anopheles sinensis TaxID=74873 RepID=A0A084W5E9_ANOSI|nr:putative glycoside hydrolase [Anopheles sinensis]